MNSDLIGKVRDALEGWLRGDVAPLESLMDPEVELLWWRTGEWDVRGKSEVMSLLKQRAAQRASEITIDVTAEGDDALIVSRVAPPDQGQLPATLITFKNGLIIKMHQFRSAEEASKAAPWRARAAR
jgi:hypothetical protein